MTSGKSVRCFLLCLCISNASLVVAQDSAEQRTLRAFEQARKNPLELRVFLQGMPKGGDLHLHLSGGTVYSETLIRDAVQDGLCVKTASHDSFQTAG